jgi:hypothetical protein
MTDTLHNPYHYNPNCTYLSITEKAPRITSCTGKSVKYKQVQVKRTSGISAFKNLMRSISRWGYFQLEYYILALLIVSILLMLGFFLSAMVIGLVLR